MNSELKLQLTMEHLKECPSDLSPNKDYLLGVYAGIDAAFNHVDSVGQDVLAEELMQFHLDNPEEDDCQNK